MAIETITRATKILLDRTWEGRAKKQLYEMLHPVKIETTNAGFEVDQYTNTPGALRVIKKNGASETRQFSAGSGQIFEPLVSSEKTPIDSNLMDAVLAGLEPTAAADQYAEIVRQILYGTNGFVIGDTMQKNKAAMDLLRTGKFSRVDRDGTSKDIDYSRPAGNSITYNFTTAGNHIDAAFKAMMDVAEAYGIPTASIGIIIGKSWKNNLLRDSNVLDRLKAWQGRMLEMLPKEWTNVEGLSYLGTYAPTGMAQTINLFSYAPQWQYRVNGGAAANYILDTEAVMFNMDEQAYRINTGIDIIEPSTQKIKRVKGDLVFTSFTNPDPAIEYLVAKNRYAFVRNVYHTVRSVGTF